MMSKHSITNRLSRYLIARQRRAARLEALDQAVHAGILDCRQFGETDQSGTVWQLTVDHAVQLSGDSEHDRELIRAVFEASKKGRKHDGPTAEADEFSEFAGSVDLDEFSAAGEAHAEGRIEAYKSAQSPGSKVEPPADFANGNSRAGVASKGRQQGAPGRISLSQKDLAARREQVLSIVQGLAPSLKPAEVATALLLANAAGRDDRVLNQLLSVIKSRTAIFAVRVPVYDFVREFGLMLENGLVLPFHTSHGAIGHSQTLSGRHKALADLKRRRSFECLKGSLARRLDDEELRDIVSRKVLGQNKPVLIADASAEPLPGRLIAAADIVIEGGGIDASMIADVLAICCDIPVARSWFLMQELAFEPKHLGIDDLAVAIRVGRSLKRMIGLLMSLEAENAANVDDESRGSKKPGEPSTSKAPAGSMVASNRKKYSGCFDVIEPMESSAQSVPGNSSTGQKLSGLISHKDHLLVERLTGYGAARQWALDLKMDLEAFKSNEVEWSDLSSRLLLSGPPGTGKTTFARALCNTLELPLVATSVARWLETSHLGDVLAAIGATFDHVSQHAPCILFIDEIDNIGSRGGGGGRPFDEYWSTLVNRLLELLDGASKTTGVIIVGATNRPEKIDPALLRSGRLEKHIIIPPPDTEALIGIIAHHLGADLDAVVEGSDAVRKGGSINGAEPQADTGAKQDSRDGIRTEPENHIAQSNDNPKGVFANG
ncbi:ATP-binding protein [Hoeflea sp.]|uniref:ATP-binding protein n=1 Tax=Hoeflea sp. TaxID=1940281 RepID=UPI003A90CDE4